LYPEQRDLLQAHLFDAHFLKVVEVMQSVQAPPPIPQAVSWVPDSQRLDALQQPLLHEVALQGLHVPLKQVLLAPVVQSVQAAALIPHTSSDVPGWHLLSAEQQPVLHELTVHGKQVLR
jgi:hypothetical protein